MDQRQINVIGTQLAQAFAQAGQQVVVVEVADPDLGGQEQGFARHRATGQCIAEVGFVVVDLRGVEGAIAQVQRVVYGIGEHLAFQAVSAKADGRNGH
ncbi:hypothetical protein D3C81_1480340 [compost metagenome]